MAGRCGPLVPQEEEREASVGPFGTRVGGPEPAPAASVGGMTRRTAHPFRRLALLGVLALLVGAVLLAGRLVNAWEGERGPAGLDASFDAGDPAVARLDPSLREAVWKAAAAGLREGETLRLNSGWRSREHQTRLFEEAVGSYGSVRAARRFVASPERSSHVSGDAVDVGPPAAAAWLDRHGARFGLCRTFANETWHFELATEPGGRCPQLLPDASVLG